MPSSVYISEAARHFQVSVDTVRRWIRNGCPCARPGQSGRNKGALLNLQDVARWRAAQTGTATATGAELMERIDTALLDVMRRDGGNGHPITVDIGVSDDQAMVLLTHASQRIARVLVGGG